MLPRPRWAPEVELDPRGGSAKTGLGTSYRRHQVAMGLTVVGECSYFKRAFLAVHLFNPLLYVFLSHNPNPMPLESPSDNRVTGGKLTL